MKFSGLNAAKDRPRIGAESRGGLVRRDHQNVPTALLTPGAHLLNAMADGHTLARLNRDDCCFSLASHVHGLKNISVAVIGFGKILARNSSPRKISVYFENILCGEASENL
jgi:hypothetical protein